MAKNAAIGNLNLAVVGLSEKAINLLIDLAHRYGGERSQDWMRKTTEMVSSGLAADTTDNGPPKAVVTQVAIPELITRSAKVNRTRTPEEAMVATGRAPYLNKVVLATVPLRESGEVTMLFCNLGKQVAADELDGELAKLGLVLEVDPVGQAGVNEADQEFADTHPNGTQWKDAQGNYCYAFFNRWGDERKVDVDQNDNDWHGHWWFPVRRLSAEADK